MTPRLKLISEVVTRLRYGQIASFEAVAGVLEIIQRDCALSDPTPMFTEVERQVIAASAAPLFIAGLKEALPDHLPEVMVTLSLKTPRYGSRYDDAYTL